MLTQTPHSATSSPHPQRVPVESLAKGTRRASRQQIGRSRNRASLAANALNNGASEKQGLSVALARNPVGDGLENLSMPGEGNIQKIHYLTGGDGSLFAMYVIDQNNQGKMYYIYTDHLGSPKLITDAECNVVQELSFDACCVKLGFCEHSETKPLVEPIPSLREGNLRDPATWQPYTSLTSIPSPLIDRGFTFHSLPREERNGEHLYPFTLINMLSAAKSRSEAFAGNGRAGVYPERCNRFGNPLVGRFLSADPYIQAPDNPQNLNRYSYCLNNPLKYSDPTGNEWWNPIDWFIDFMDWINNVTKDIRQQLEEIDFPNCNIGGNMSLDGQNWGVYGGLDRGINASYDNEMGWGFGYNDGTSGERMFYYPMYNYSVVEQNAMNDYNAGRTEAIKDNLSFINSNKWGALSLSGQVQAGVTIVEGGIILTSNGVVPFYNKLLGASPDLSIGVNAGYFHNEKQNGMDLYPEDIAGEFWMGYGSVAYKNLSIGGAYSRASGNSKSPYTLWEGSVSLSANPFHSPVTGGYYHGWTTISDYRIFLMGSQPYILKIKK